MQTVPLRCRCGTVRGEVETGHAYGHALCYCRDCQAWAAWIDDAGMTDGRGGTGIVATSPPRVRITHGRDRLACISLGPKGLLRWYAACCRTAIANTPRDAKVAYVGLIAASLDRRDGGAAAAFGPPRFVLNPKSAPVPVDGTPVATLFGGLRIVLGLVAARLRGRHDTPFFDAASGEPVATPSVLPASERARLTPSG